MADPKLHVLIVGIDHWLNEDLPKLKGAVNDAELMAHVFRERFGVTDDHMMMLINEKATREGIESAFRTHLIDRAESWSKGGGQGPSPAFVFVYAGHGSRAADPTGTQADGKDETIVPYDSRVEGVFDIKDWEIGGWLAELTEFSDNVTVIMDCCHSGSGTRDTEDDLGTSRICDSDDRQQPARTVPNDEAVVPITASTRVVSHAERDEPEREQSERDQPERSDEKLNRYVLLAACRSFEAAKEYKVRGEENQRADQKPYKHGAFTWFLAKELMNLPPGGQVTYQEIFERARFRVHRKYRSQMPQIEGDRDRFLFGSARVLRDPLVTVIDRNETGIWIDAGAVQGVGVGAELDVYPPGTRTIDPGEDPVSKLSVNYVEPVRSRCELIGDGSIEPLCKAQFVGSASRITPHLVTVNVSDETLEEEIVARFGEDDLATYVRVTQDREAAAYLVGMTEDALTLKNQAGELLVKQIREGTDFETIEQLAGNLSAICRWYNVLNLENDDQGSQLRGKIGLHFHEVIDDDEFEETRDEAGQIAGRRVRRIRDIPRTAEGLPIFTIDQSVAIEVRNQSAVPLYIEAISFGWDYAIVPITGAICDEGVRKRVEPGGTIWFGRDESEIPLAPGLPPDPEVQRSFTEAFEFVKVVATTDEPNFDVLRQDGLSMPVDEYVDDGEMYDESTEEPADDESDGTRSAGGDTALDELFAQAMTGTRALGAKRKRRKKRDWTTVDCEVLVAKEAEPES